MRNSLIIQALKRKKKYEQQLVQIDGTLTTLEQQRETLESAQSNTKILSTMGDAAKALKKAHAHMDVDKVCFNCDQYFFGILIFLVSRLLQVHDMIDDISEQQQVAKEISDAISSPVNWNADFDEDDLEAELDGLLEEQELEEQSTLDEELLKVGPTPVLPDIPVDAVPAAQPAAASKPKKAVVEEDEMAELAAWAS